MTEDEAKTKWCPFARTVTVTDGEVVPGTSGNRHHYESDIVSYDHPNNCIASECMAWRWDAGENVSNPNPKNTDQGYCGLAK